LRLDNISIYFGDFLVLTSFILAVLFSIGFSRNRKAYKIFTLYLVFIAILQMVMYYFTLYKWNNIFLFHFYFVGQFIFMSLFYYELLLNKIVYVILGLGLIAIGIQYTLQPDIFYEYHTYGVSATQSIIVLYAMVHYYKSLTTTLSYFIYINTGVLLYFMTSILFFASGNLMLNLNIPKETQRYILLINLFLYFLFQILIFVEWYRNYRVKKVYF
jgi:hypothetical protein